MLFLVISRSPLYSALMNYKAIQFYNIGGNVLAKLIIIKRLTKTNTL